MKDATPDDVISLIYEAASGQVHWKLALEGVRKRLECLVVQIVGIDVLRGQFLFSFESEGMLTESQIAEATIDYARVYHRIDPHAAYVSSGAPGQLISFSRVFNQSFVDSNVFYQDFLIPYGSRHMHGAKLHEADGVVTMLGIHRGLGQQPLDGTKWIEAQRFCFHLSKAAELFSTTRRVAVDSVIAHDLLNRLTTPVYLVNANRQVVMRNQAARESPQASEPLQVGINGDLVCSDAEANKHITLALEALRNSFSDSCSEIQRIRVVVRVNRTGRLGSDLLCIDDIQPSETMFAFGHQPVVMITYYRMGARPPLDPFFVAYAFDLTPAEAAVAVAIASGLSPKEIAMQRQSALNTVLAQVRSIHGKLGVRRNTEVVVLLHSVSMHSKTRTSV